MPRPTVLPPVRHQMVSGNGVPIHVAELTGEGPPMMLVHGIGMDWRVWQAISRRLHPHFHLYMLDLRGHGTSGKPARGYTPAHYASDLEEVIDRLGLQGTVLVGSSLGGVAAAAVEAPSDIVAARVLVDPPLTGGPIRDPEMFRAILRLKHQPPDVLALYLATSNPGAGAHYLRAMSDMWHEAADGVIEDMLARPDDYYDLDSALRAIDAPVLLMQADPDRGGVLSDVDARRALDVLPHGILRQFPAAGHAIHADQPAEFVQTILDLTNG